MEEQRRIFNGEGGGLTDATADPCDAEHPVKMSFDRAVPWAAGGGGLGLVIGILVAVFASDPATIHALWVGPLVGVGFFGSMVALPVWLHNSSGASRLPRK